MLITLHGAPLGRGQAHLHTKRMKDALRLDTSPSGLPAARAGGFSTKSMGEGVMNIIEVSHWNTCYSFTAQLIISSGSKYINSQWDEWLCYGNVLPWHLTSVMIITSSVMMRFPAGIRKKADINKIPSMAVNWAYVTVEDGITTDKSCSDNFFCGCTWSKPATSLIKFLQN